MGADDAGQVKFGKEGGGWITVERGVKSRPSLRDKCVGYYYLFLTIYVGYYYLFITICVGYHYLFVLITTTAASSCVGLEGVKALETVP